jgi:hypothetical protein
MSDSDPDKNQPQKSRGMPTERDTEAFQPRVQWQIWVPVLLALALFGVAYKVVEHRKETAIRAKLLAEHAELTGPIAPRYRQVRAKVERLTMTAVAAYAGDLVAPGFDVQRLRREPVLYGRVRSREIQRIDQVAPSIRRRFDDQVGACAGIEVEKVWRFYDRGEFLMPSYIDAVRPAEGSERLRFLREDLLTRLRTDTPELVAMGRRSIFVLIVDEGSSQIDGPSRFYAWDLESEQPLLRARAIGSETVIVPVRIAGMPGGGRPVPAPSGALTVTMHDCSLANRVKALLGVATDDARSAPDVPTPAETAASGADAQANGDASVSSGAQDR